MDRGAGFDVRTLISRRAVLSLIGLGLGVGASALGACASTGSSPPARAYPAPAVRR